MPRIELKQISQSKDKPLNSYEIDHFLLYRISYHIGDYYASTKDYEHAIKSYKEATYYCDTDVNVC